MIGRRGFLKGLATAVAAAPIVAKALTAEPEPSGYAWTAARVEAGETTWEEAYPLRHYQAMPDGGLISRETFMREYLLMDSDMIEDLNYHMTMKANVAALHRTGAFNMIGHPFGLEEHD